MTDFKVIETQEQLDSIIGERLKREQKKFDEEKEKWEAEKTKLGADIEALTKTITDTNEKYAGTDEALEGLKSQIKNYEQDSVKIKLAHEMGIPYELKDTIQGSDEESMRQNAEILSKYIKTKEAPPPFNPEPPIKQGSDAEYGALLKNLQVGKE